MIMKNVDESYKFAIDLVSAGAVVGMVMNILTPLAAIFTIVWTGIRIYETNTVQRMLGKKK